MNHRPATRRLGRRRGFPLAGVIAILVVGFTTVVLEQPASAASTTAGFDGVLTSRARTISYEVALTDGTLGGTLAFSAAPAGGPTPVATVSLFSAGGRRLVTRHGPGPLMFERELAAGTYTLRVSTAPRQRRSLAFDLEVTHVTSVPDPAEGAADENAEDEDAADEACGM